MSTTSLRTLVPRGLNTIVKENNIARFVDPQFTIDKLRLSRSAYLGHLASGNQKGKKIYSPHRPLPTYTSSNDTIVLDTRDPRTTGIRYLTRSEVLRINNHPKPIKQFLQQCSYTAACKYIANAIPSGMVKKIWTTVVDDLLCPSTEPLQSPTMNVFHHYKLTVNSRSPYNQITRRHRRRTGGTLQLCILQMRGKTATRDTSY